MQLDWMANVDERMEGSVDKQVCIIFWDKIKIHPNFHFNTPARVRVHQSTAVGALPGSTKVDLCPAVGIEQWN